MSRALPVLWMRKRWVYLCSYDWPDLNCCRVMSNQAEIQICLRKYSQQYAYFREDELFINTLLHILNIFFKLCFQIIVRNWLKTSKNRKHFTSWYVNQLKLFIYQKAFSLTAASWHLHTALVANINSYPAITPIHMVHGACRTWSLSLAVVRAQFGVVWQLATNTWNCIGLTL